MKYIILFLLLTNIIIAENSIKGFVLDKANNPLAGVNIRIETTPYGAVTKKDGSFVIKNIPEKIKKGNLIISYIGYQTINAEINFNEKTEPYTFNMEIQPLQTGEVVISANKRVQAVQDVPISMSVIDSRGIIDRAINKLDEALSYVPGVEINQDNISIRGTSGFSFGIGSRVSLLLDGFSMIAGDNSDVKFDALPMFNIERIEIVKGAGSALYGTSALGGVVNLITTQPNENPEFRIKAYSGIFTKPRFEQWKYSDVYSFNQGLSGSFSQKFDALGLTASAQYINDQSYRKYDDSYRWSIFTKAGYELSDFSNISLMFNAASEDRTDWVYWNSLDSATIPPTDTDYGIRLTSDKFSLSGDYSQILTDNSFMTFRTGIFYTDYKNNYKSDDVAFRQSEAVNFNSELQFNTRLNSSFMFTYGLNAILINVASKTYGNQQQKIYAGYFQAEYNGIESLIITAGSRIDYEDVKEIKSDLEISPKLGLSYHLDKKSVLRLSAGRGFRAPAVAERYSTVSFQGFDVLPNPELKPEYSWSYEAGINYETNIFSFPLFVDFSLFNNELYDLIEPTFVSSTSSEIQFRNVTRARISGAELNIKTFLFGLMGFETALTYMDPRDITLNKTLNYRSELLWYCRLMLPLKYLDINIDYRFKSKAENIDKQLSLIVNDVDARVDMQVLDLGLIFNLNNIIDYNARISLIAKNLLDYYYTEMVGNLAPTRQIILQAEIKF